MPHPTHRFSRVHTGFWDAYTTIRFEVLESVQRAMQEAEEEGDMYVYTIYTVRRLSFV